MNKNLGFSSLTSLLNKSSNITKALLQSISSGFSSDGILPFYHPGFAMFLVVVILFHNTLTGFPLTITTLGSIVTPSGLFRLMLKRIRRPWLPLHDLVLSYKLNPFSRMVGSNGT